MPKVDVRGEKCPIPLIKTRKAAENMRVGEVLEVVGEEADSKVEVLLAIKELRMEIIELEETEVKWRVVAKKVK